MAGRKASDTGHGRGGLTELEGAVLGNLAQEGPGTAYRVRMCFADSPSAVWSGSAGAIYPLLQRLEKRGLLRSTAVRQGQRAGREYTLSAAGRVALRTWLTDTAAAADLGFDPLRTRGLSLSTLGVAQRRKFLASVRKELQAQRDAIRGRARVGQVTPDEASVNRGVILQIEAKLKWLDELEKPVGR